MVNPFNEPDDLESRLKFLGPNQDQWDLEDRLLDATLELETMVGRTVEEHLYPTVEEQNDFSFAFSNIHELITVEIISPQGTFDQTVDSSNYTVTKDPDRSNPTNISFDSDWAEDNLHNTDYRLRARYIPELFKRLELRLAELDIVTLASIQTGDEERAVQAEKARERVQRLQERINRTTQNLGDTTAGRNLAANYNYPGDKY